MTYATRIIRYLNACSSIPFTYSELINYRIERGQDSNLVMLLIRSQTRYPLTATRRWHQHGYFHRHECLFANVSSGNKALHLTISNGVHFKIFFFTG